MKLAAIDIGSNSIHLVVVRAKEGQHLEIIDREKEMVRLGSGTLRDHRLSEDTMERAITTLRRYKQMAEANRVDLIIATATSAVRESDNANEFIELVRAKVGLDIQLLPGVEEARLIALAVSEVTEFNGRRALIIDIGGGSTELIISNGSEQDLLISMRLGAVRLSEKFITTDPVSRLERDLLVASIRADLSRVVREIKQVGFDFVIGTSGTILNMVEAVVQAEESAGVTNPEGFVSFSQTITTESLSRLNRRLSRMTVRDRSRVPGLEKERADIIVAGGLLLETILTELGVEELTTCDWSLREGVILDYLRKHFTRANQGEAITQPAADVAVEEIDTLLDPSVATSRLDVRSRSVLSVARRYDYDPLHSHHVALLASRIFDDTYDLHGMGEQERKLLQYAALLHDIGYHIAPNNHHNHALYLIKHSEMPGFTANEIAIMATAVRYHRGSMPKKGADGRARSDHDEFYALERGHRPTVLKMAAILQMADGFDRSHCQLVKSVSCRLDGHTAVMSVECRADCELEIWSAERKSGWFRDLFNVSVKIERAPARAVAGNTGAILTTL